MCLKGYVFISNIRQEPGALGRWSFKDSRRLFAALSLLGTGLVFFSAWLVTAGPIDPIAHTAAFLQHLVSSWMLATYFTAAALIGFGTWYQHSAPKRAVKSAEIQTTMKRQTVRLVFVWLAVSACLVLVGFLYIRDVENTSRRERSSQQEAVARLKAQQIDKWLLERIIDVEALSHSLRELPLERLPSDRATRLAVELLFGETLVGSSERISVSLFALDGRVLSHAGEGSAPDQETARAALAVATGPDRGPSIVDVHLDGMPQRPRLVILVQVTARSRSGPAIAILAMAIDPFDALFPQILTWPTSSPSSEAIVLRREGDDVVFITPPPLLTPAPAPLAFRAPVAGSKLPSAEAVVARDAVLTGRDYRGVEVLAASRHVTGMPWVVIAKTDLDEINRPLQRKEFTLVVVIGAAVVLAAIMLVVLWRGEYASLLMFRTQQRQGLLLLAQHFGRLTELARDAFLLIGPDGRILEANKAAVAAYGYSAEELHDINVRDLQLQHELVSFEARWQATALGDGLQFETVHRRKDGSIFPVEVNMAPVNVDGTFYRQAFIRDITRRKALEHKNVRLSEVKAALQATTSVLLRATTGAELLQGICEVLVQFGDYRMANVAIPNGDPDKTVRFVAIAGFEDGYLDAAALSWGEGPRSKGPTGTAIRTGEVQVNQDFATNPAMGPWREAALRCGYHSTIGLPLKLKGKVLGALTLYAEQPNAFDEEERALLTALAGDVSYAMAKLREGPGTEGAASRATA